MTIEINNKEYQLDFSYTFVKWVFKRRKFTKFAQYYQYLGQLAFDEESFAPEHVELFAELVIYGIEAAQQKNSKLKKGDLEAYLFQHPAVMQQVAQTFMESQPKLKESVVDSQVVGK